VRREAVIALAALRDPRAVELIAAWQPRDSWERMRMLEALGWTDNPDAVPHLLQAASTPDIGENARAAIAASLATLGASEHSGFYISQILDKSLSASHRNDIARAVAVFDAKFRDAVISVVEDVADDMIVRGNLLYVLASVDAKRAFDTAVWVLSRPEDKRIHWQAVGVFERIGDKRAIPYIEKALVGADDTLKRVAERALAKLKGS
jgi:HEAT repeat protein